LFYLNGDGVMAVDIRTAPTIAAEVPRRLHEFRSPLFQATSLFDVSNDGRFLRIQSSVPETVTTPIHVVINWLEELKTRVPCNESPA
jgi:hypothetical protein